jgi:hypothetical protein
VKGRDHLEDLGIDGRIILKSFIKKLDVRMWLRIGSKHGNETLGLIYDLELSQRLNSMESKCWYHTDT